MNVTTVKNAKVGDLVSIELSTDVYKVVRVGEDGVIMENIEDPTKTTKVSNNTLVFIYDAPVGALISALSDFRQEIAHEFGSENNRTAEKCAGKLRSAQEIIKDKLEEDDLDGGDEYEGDYDEKDDAYEEEYEELDNESGVSVYELIDQLDVLEERGWNTSEFRRDLAFILSSMALGDRDNEYRDENRPMDALSYLFDSNDEN